MNAKPSRKTMSVKKLTSKAEVNVRLLNNYDLTTMLEQIVQAGRILKPIIGEQVADDVIVLSGNRRVRAAQMGVENPNLISAILLTIADGEKDLAKANELRKNLQTHVKELLDNLDKVEVLVYSGLTEEERLMLIMDHGSEKPISRAEVVSCVWRMDKSFFSEADIIKLTYFALAKYTGNERKLSEVPTEPKARESMLRKWLHGTVGNYILAAHKMGPRVTEQFFLTAKAEDGLLEDGEKVTIKMSRDRITQLSAAKNKEKDIWTPEDGSPEFNALLKKFEEEDAGTVEKEKKVRPTVKELNDKADVFKSKAIQKAFRLAAGETGEKVAGLIEDDDRMYRDEKALAALAEAYDTLPTELKEFVGHVLDDSPANLKKYLKSLVESEVATTASK